MRAAFGTAVVLALLWAPVPLASVAQSPPAETQLIAALEDSLWATSRDDRAQAFGRYLAPDYRGVYADGVHDKAKEILTLNEVSIETYQLKDLQVRQIGPRMYAITYRATVTGRYQDYNLAGEYWCSTIWEFTGGRWQALMHTETKAP
jgi:hypothetical protein